MPSFSMAGPIAVIDVETTGLFPHRHDRVVEVAVVVIHANGEVVREFVSLVNPGRDLGPTRIHGLTAEDILGAPQFGEIAAMVLDAMAGSVAIAGHNVHFDRRFVISEFERLGQALPDFFSMCTMKMGRGQSLQVCCRDSGIQLEGESHSALADARATARLLVHQLATNPAKAHELGGLPPIEWPSFARAVRQPVTRDQTKIRKAAPPTYLQRLLDIVRAQTVPIVDNDAAMAYWALLDRVIEDRYVDDLEADALVDSAMRWGLSGEHITQLHRAYLNRLARVALVDGIITDAERRDLTSVARLLGYGPVDFDNLGETAVAAGGIPEHPTPALSNELLTGRRVCFTGELQCYYQGRVITREYAAELATRAGLEVVDSVTKQLDLLVVADPQTQSGKAVKARKYGVRILHESVFWKALGVDVQ